MFNISNTNIYIFYGSMRDGHFESINTQFNMQNAQIILQIHLYFKVQVYSLISSLKTYHHTLHLTPWSLDLFIRVPFQLHEEHTILQPLRRIVFIVHIAISFLPGTYFYLSQVKHF